MKPLQTLILVCGLLSAPILSAMPSFFDNPNYKGNQDGWDTFAGLDLKQSWITTTAPWQYLLNAKGLGVGFYAGQRIHPMIAWELGYGFGKDQIKKTSTLNGTTVLGVTNRDGVTATVQGRLHLKTAYADLNFLIPLMEVVDQNPEAILSLGVAMIKPSVNISIVNNPSSSLAPLTTFNASTRAAARFGLGFQSFLIGDVGMRFMWRFENTAALRINNTGNADFASFLKNGQSLSLGLFMRL